MLHQAIRHDDINHGCFDSREASGCQLFSLDGCLEIDSNSALMAGVRLRPLDGFHLITSTCCVDDLDRACHLHIDLRLAEEVSLAPRNFFGRCLRLLLVHHVVGPISHICDHLGRIIRWAHVSTHKLRQLLLLLIINVFSRKVGLPI